MEVQGGLYHGCGCRTGQSPTSTAAGVCYRSHSRQRTAAVLSGEAVRGCMWIQPFPAGQSQRPSLQTPRVHSSGPGEGLPKSETSVIFKIAFLIIFPSEKSTNEALFRKSPNACECYSFPAQSQLCNEQEDNTLETPEQQALYENPWEHSWEQAEAEEEGDKQRVPLGSRTLPKADPSTSHSSHSQQQHLGCSASEVHQTQPSQVLPLRQHSATLAREEELQARVQRVPGVRSAYEPLKAQQQHTLLTIWRIKS